MENVLLALKYLAEPPPSSISNNNLLSTVLIQPISHSEVDEWTGDEG
jgi:hypothetical protein